MAIEPTLVCDLCGTVVDGNTTVSELLRRVKAENSATRLRVGNRMFDVCRSCVSDAGGTNAVRKKLRANLA